jgi:hypothetical protein
VSSAERTKAISRGVVAWLVVALLAPIPVLWLLNSSGIYDGLAIKTATISPLSPPYANNTYTDVQIIVDNGGDTTAEECFVRAYDVNLLADKPDDTPASGESERFDLPPGGGHLTIVSIRLSDTGEVSSQDGVPALVVGPYVFRTECRNAESPYV